MKNIVLSLTADQGRSIINVTFSGFKITKDFKIKKNNEEWYCAEITYQYEYDYKDMNGDGRLTNPTRHNYTQKDKAHFCFTKRGNKWHGVQGWVNE